MTENLKIPKDVQGTPENVALEMAKYLVETERAEANSTEEFLKLYSQCLKATKGQRV
jgi:hypothetical protein